MFKGFYNLTSSMLTHQQNLNVIANNMVNISTAGYKQDLYTASTFDDVMYSRMGNKHNTGQEIGRQSYIRAASRIYTDYTQGILEPTGIGAGLCHSWRRLFCRSGPGWRDCIYAYGQFFAG